MMRYALSICLGLIVLGLVVEGGAGGEYTVDGPACLPGYMLGVVKGKVRLLAKGGRGGVDWVLKKGEEEGILIKVLSERSSDINGQWNGWYLSYDPEGKDPEVIVTEKPGPGSYWKVYYNAHGSAVTGITAKNGKFKGWKINMGAVAEPRAWRDRYGKPFLVYSAVLDRHPRGGAPLFTFKHIAP
jgi:hypothetical protein